MTMTIECQEWGAVYDVDLASRPGSSKGPCSTYKQILPFILQVSIQVDKCAHADGKLQSRKW